MAKIISIANQKGGVGKTTTTINLSSLLAAAEKRTLLIDIDPQANSSSGLSVTNHTPSVYEVLVGTKNIKDVIINSFMPFLDMLPSNINLVGAEIEMVNMISRETLLKKALENMTEKFDYILIDCPPSLGLLTLNALSAAQKLIIPIQCEYFALEGLGQLIETTKLIRGINPSLTIGGVILTMYDSRTKLSENVVKDVKDFFGDIAFNTIVPRNVRLSEAPSYGKTIFQYDKNSTGAFAYRRLASEFIDRFEK